MKQNNFFLLSVFFVYCSSYTMNREDDRHFLQNIILYKDEFNTVTINQKDILSEKLIVSFKNLVKIPKN